MHFQIRDRDQDELVAVYLQSHAIHAVNQRKVSSVHLLCITEKGKFNAKILMANESGKLEWQSSLDT